MATGGRLSPTARLPSKRRDSPARRAGPRARLRSSARPRGSRALSRPNRSTALRPRVVRMRPVPACGGGAGGSAREDASAPARRHSRPPAAAQSVRLVGHGAHVSARAPARPTLSPHPHSSALAGPASRFWLHVPMRDRFKSPNTDRILNRQNPGREGAGFSERWLWEKLSLNQTQRMCSAHEHGRARLGFQSPSALFFYPPLSEPWVFDRVPRRATGQIPRILYGLQE